MTENPLTELIELEELDKNLFRGENYPAAWGQVFGGQVLAQSLNAARRSVATDRLVHSMHGYFILPGQLDKPIIYQVEAIRDGGSFNTRRVVAFQKGRAIFNMSCSFQVQEEGFSHQQPMPDVPSYTELMSDREWAEKHKTELPAFYKKFMTKRHIEFRPVEAIDILDPKKTDPFRKIWLKCEETIGDHQALHKEILAFASDYNLMSTALIPHRKFFKPEDMQMASLDHAMWFHRDFRVDEWLLFSLDSPAASNGRGFNRGSFFNEKGDLVASVAQEGLMRNKKLK